MEQYRTLRVTKINRFLLNDGRFISFNFIIVFILTLETFLTLIMCLDYKFYSYPEKNIFEILNQVGGDIFILNRYFLMEYIDNLIIRTINSYLSDFKNFSLSIPYFSDYINYKNFELDITRYIYIAISFILTFFCFSLIILQIRDQKKFRTLGLFSIYSPFFLILFSHIQKEYFYFKRVEGIKRDTMNDEKKRSFIEIFFHNSKKFKNNDINFLDLKIETKTAFLGFYNYYKLSLIDKTLKKTK